MDDRLELDPHAPAIDGVCTVLDQLTARIGAHVPGALAGEDTEDLHQLRVAVRASRAVLGEMKSVLGGPVVLRARQELAWLGRVTGPARDLDVLTEAWPSYAASVGIDVEGIGRVQGLLGERRESARVALVDGLGSARVHEFLDGWTAALADPTAGLEGRRAERTLGRVVARRVVACHGRLLEHARRIGPASNPVELHDLRKDAKSVRYVVDCFAPAFEERARRRYAKRLRALQRVLGDHQDADVHAEAMRDLAGDARIDASLGYALGRVHERLVQQRQAARADFDARFEVFDSTATTSVLDAAVLSIGA
jgi:CHAD domain-containing protein